MELHPFLEPDIRPAPKWWYVVSAVGDCPSVRVGHSVTFMPALHAGEHDKVYIIGGANPSQVFAEVYVLDLVARAWDTCEAVGFRARYEHAAFTVSVHPGKIFIFGGATQTGNLNDVQSMDTSSGSWSDIETQGTPPSPRTHRCSAIVGSKFYVYSGGQCGSDPVGDRRVHCFDTANMQWTNFAPNGDPPKPRHGHFMISIGSRIYLHGGMAGTTFYDDFHILDLERNSWTAVKKKKTTPPPRAAHDGICHGAMIYVFGGMNKNGALDDAYILNTGEESYIMFF